MFHPEIAAGDVGWLEKTNGGRLGPRATERSVEGV